MRVKFEDTVNGIIIYADTLKEVTEPYIQEAIKKGIPATKIASILGISYQALHHKLKKNG